LYPSASSVARRLGIHPDVAAKTGVWHLGGLSAKKFFQKLWQRFWDDAILSRAGELAFFLMLAALPLLLVITVVLAALATEGTDLRSMLLSYASHVLPDTASGAVKNALKEINQHLHGRTLTVGLVIAVWSASQGMQALIQILNRTYDVSETRPFWKQRLIAIGLTLFLMAFLILALVVVLMGGWVASYVASSSGSSIWLDIWYALRWPLVVLLVFIGFGWVYLLAPNFEEHRWYWVTPGALTGVAVWLSASYLFKVYLGHFHSYAATYGSFGAIIVMMLWFYVTSIALMIGGETNAIIEHAANELGNPDARQRHESRTQKGSEKKAA
jgi:membrane protein